MELIFKNKEPISKILEVADKYEGYGKLALDNSMVIYGDNFAEMAKLLKSKKGFLDLVYIDPPFNTNQCFYISNGRANTISNSKSGKVAYSDIMESDEFIKFLYERFVLIRELLSEKGSLYVHIDKKMGHCIKIILDEIFGAENFKNDITRIKSNPKNFDRKAYGNETDMILFYSKNYRHSIWNECKIPLTKNEVEKKFTKTDENGRRYTTIPLHAPGETLDGITGKPWRNIMPPKGRHWRTDPAEFDRLDALGRIEWSKNGNPRIKKYADEHKGKKIQDVWLFKDPQNPKYPTQKNIDLIKQIIAQSSNVNGYVMDCFAGSGTTLVAANELGRKFIGIDISKQAIKVINKTLKNVDYITVNGIN